MQRDRLKFSRIEPTSRQYFLPQSHIKPDKLPIIALDQVEDELELSIVLSVIL